MCGIKNMQQITKVSIFASKLPLEFFMSFSFLFKCAKVFPKPAFAKYLETLIYNYFLIAEKKLRNHPLIIILVTI
jgi:hypothetical protein